MNNGVYKNMGGGGVNKISLIFVKGMGSFSIKDDISKTFLPAHLLTAVSLTIKGFFSHERYTFVSRKFCCLVTNFNIVVPDGLGHQ